MLDSTFGHVGCDRLQIERLTGGGEAAVNRLEFANNNPELSPELLEVVKTIQDALSEKRARLQFETVDSGPSALEDALVRESVNRPVHGIVSHPQLLAAVVESAGAAIFSETIDGTVLTWNNGAQRIFGFSAEEVVGQDHGCMLPDFIKKEEAKIWQRVASGEAINNYEAIRQDRDGRLVDLSMSISPILEAEKVVRVVIVAQDITERKRMLRALMESERKQRQRVAELKAVLDAVPTPVWIAHDTECKRVTGNDAAYAMLKLPQGSNLSFSAPENEQPTHYAIYRNGRALAADELPVQMAASQGVEVRDFEQDIIFDDGTITHMVGNATPLHDSEGNITGAVSAAIDITERKSAEERIRRMAHFDSLTNLPNRVLLMDRLERAIALSARNQTHTGVLFIDLDYFKNINDTLGHHVGDMLLQQVADRLREYVREVDTVSRLGGDEFVIIVPELRQMEDARQISRKLLQSLSEPYVVSGQKLEVTPSIGVSVFPDHATEPSALIRLADQAMYQAKQEGRRTIRFYGT
jgi:diguanylate cyclase (GGDEF)-like protein/PAS domain S-box-containing protein